MTRPKFEVINVRLPESEQKQLTEIYDEWIKVNGTEPSLRQIIIRLITDYRIQR